MTWPIGDYYVREWENDVIHGPGRYCHGKQKLIYEGNFKMIRGKMMVKLLMRKGWCLQ